MIIKKVGRSNWNFGVIKGRTSSKKNNSKFFEHSRGENLYELFKKN